MNNPYSMMFGKEPTQLISRTTQLQQVIESFFSTPSSQQIYMITGVRGVGKTVFMTEIAKKFSHEEDWVVVELNPEIDLLESLAAHLSSKQKLAKIFQSAKINLSFFGLGVDIKGTTPITNIELALQEMISTLKKKGKRVLICIDEATNTPQMKAFSAAFQILVRKDLPVYLLMTGLYESISALQNEKSLTFLYRAPKIYLGPLNIANIALDYESVLKIDRQKSIELAKLTKGYSYAFQVFGYFSWEYPKDYEKAMSLSRQYLNEYVYEKIWSELSRKDKEIVHAIAETKTGRVIDIRDYLHLEPNEFSPYRERLIRKGILAGEDRGYVEILLPFFDDYALASY